MAGKRKSMMLGTPINQPPAPLEAMPQPPRLTPPPRTASAAPAPNPGLGLVAWPGEGMMSPPGRLSPKGSIGSSDEHASPHSAQSPLLGSPAANMMREADGSTPLMRSERLATNMRGGGGDMSEFSPEPVTMSRHHSLTPSMSASNLESQAGSNSGHGQTKFEYLLASNRKLLTSKEKYEFDAAYWSGRGAEEDDALHDPGPAPARKDAERRIQDIAGSAGCCNARGLLNVGSIALIALALLMTFAGAPLYTYFNHKRLGNLGAFNSGGINGTGQIADIPGFRGLIDKDTPASAMSRIGTDGAEYELVFSDEFNTDGRTFWPGTHQAYWYQLLLIVGKGDDPFWTAMDIHYCTEDLEWYDPDQITTENGSLVITFDRVTDPATNHNLRYKSGMLQSWNQMCYQGGYIEAAIILPGSPMIAGYWPGFWSMGNLGRPGYGATNEGMWPYSYNECDLGTLPNQTDLLRGEPALVIANTTGMGDVYNLNGLSYLPGQRLSRCTCDGEDHPGPHNPDGSYKGRSAPEIDVLEAVVENDHGGLASQSLQLAPMDYRYIWDNTTAGTFDIYPSQQQTAINGYVGGAWQQACSALTTLPEASYELSDGEWSTFGYEYEPHDSKAVDQGYITWVTNGELNWSFRQSAGAPNPLSMVGQRDIPGEPMAVIINNGMSESFSIPDLRRMTFPGKMRVDYFRLYQRKGLEPRIGCSPPDYPTEQYINDHLNAYSNQNLTLWSDAGYNFPGNSLKDGCSAPSRK